MGGRLELQTDLQRWVVGEEDAGEPAEVPWHSQIEDRRGRGCPSPLYMSAYLGWFLLKPYEVYTYERNLYLRYATTLEANMEKDISNNYDQYVQV